MLLLFFLAISSGVVIVGCNDNKPAAIAPASGQGFTFLEMGADTLYSSRFSKWGPIHCIPDRSASD
ncbi:MAG: hypothetical protein CSB32_02050 [Desulfobacterales bacterium]|nr:MAG: hypothetical protein CSB32_02050 [Desulfobacterales bacterium]